MTTRGFVAVLVLATALAAALRLPALDQRPMHADEAVHAFKFAELWRQGRYEYDPHDYHGPTLYYLTLPGAWMGSATTLAQTDETLYRAPIAVAGVLLVAMTALLAPGLGRTATATAAVLLAVSPAMSFYSRYYIQESLLVALSFLAIVAFWRWTRGGRGAWLALGAASIGLMHATKGTWTIHAAAMLLAAGVAWLLHRRRAGQESPRRLRPLQCLAAAGLAVLVATGVLSVGFSHTPNAWASMAAFGGGIARAGSGGEGGHAAAWHQYLSWLAWGRLTDGTVLTELGILALAAMGAVAAFLPRRDAAPAPELARFLAVYALGLTAIYAAIPYKTPWIATGMHHAYILLAGVGAGWLISAVRRPRARWALAAVIAAAAGHLAYQAVLANFAHHSDPHSPWAYAHPIDPDLGAIEQAVHAAADAHPQGLGMPVQVIWPEDDYWPLPWTLRRLENVGFHSQVPPGPYAPLLLVSDRLTDDLADALYTHRPPGERTLYVRLLPTGLRLRPGETIQAFVAHDLHLRMTESQP